MNLSGYLPMNDPRPLELPSVGTADSAAGVERPGKSADPLYLGELKDHAVGLRERPYGATLIPETFLLEKLTAISSFCSAPHRLPPLTIFYFFVVPAWCLW